MLQTRETEKERNTEYIFSLGFLFACLFCFFNPHFSVVTRGGGHLASKTDLSADPWKGGMSNISRAGSERGAARIRVRLAPSETRRCEPRRSAPSGGGAEERNLGFPSR